MKVLNWDLKKKKKKRAQSLFWPQQVGVMGATNGLCCLSHAMSKVPMVGGLAFPSGLVM